MSFVAAKIQQNCTGTGNYNSKATRQGNICVQRQYKEGQVLDNGIDSRGSGGARAPPDFGGSLKGQSLISARRSLAITASASGFEKLSMALLQTYYHYCLTDNERVLKGNGHAKYQAFQIKVVHSLACLLLLLSRHQRQERRTKSSLTTILFHLTHPLYHELRSVCVNNTA